MNLLAVDDCVYMRLVVRVYLINSLIYFYVCIIVFLAMIHLARIFLEVHKASDAIWLIGLCGWRPSQISAA